MNMKKKNPARNIFGLPLCTIDGEKGVFILRTMILPRDCQSAMMDYLEGRSETLDAVPYYRGGLLPEVFTSKTNPGPWPACANSRPKASPR